MEQQDLELLDQLIHSANKSIQRLWTARLKEFSLSGAHAACLCRLAQAGQSGLTQVQLSQLEGMDRAQISRVLAELWDREYVCTTGQDRQYKKPYLLTPSGQEIAGQLQRIRLELHQLAGAQLSPQELQLVCHTLQSVIQQLEQAADSRAR